MPTIPGVLLLAALVGTAGYLLFQNAASFLAITRPVGADYLVIEGWLGKSELRQALGRFDQRGYRLAIVSGGPISDEFNRGASNYAARAHGFLVSIGFPRDRLVPVAAPYSAQDRTFLSAVMVREWLAAQDMRVNALDIFSADVHARRTRDSYRLAFGDGVEIGVYASTPEEFEIDRWWQSSDAAKAVAAELLGWVALKCCFDPGAPGSHLEKWGIEKST